MAGENSIQFNPRLANRSLAYGTPDNAAFDVASLDTPTNVGDTAQSQNTVAFKDTKTENVPQKNQDIASDDKIGKLLDGRAVLNRAYYGL